MQGTDKSVFLAQGATAMAMAMARAMAMGLPAASVLGLKRAGGFLAAAPRQHLGLLAPDPSEGGAGRQSGV